MAKDNPDDDAIMSVDAGRATAFLIAYFGFALFTYLALFAPPAIDLNSVTISAGDKVEGLFDAYVTVLSTKWRKIHALHEWIQFFTVVTGVAAAVLAPIKSEKHGFLLKVMQVTLTSTTALCLGIQSTFHLPELDRREGELLQQVEGVTNNYKTNRELLLPWIFRDGLKSDARILAEQKSIAELLKILDKQRAAEVNIGTDVAPTNENSSNIPSEGAASNVKGLPEPTKK